MKIAHKKNHEIAPIIGMDLELIADGGEKGFSLLRVSIHHADKEIGKKMRKSFVGTQAVSGFVGKVRVCNWGTITAIDKKTIVLEHKAHNKSQEAALCSLMKNIYESFPVLEG